MPKRTGTTDHFGTTIAARPLRIDRRPLRDELQRSRSDEQAQAEASVQRQVSSCSQEQQSNKEPSNASEAGKVNKVPEEGFTRARRKHGKYSHYISTSKGKTKGKEKGKGTGKGEGKVDICAPPEAVQASVPAKYVEELQAPVEEVPAVPQCVTGGCSRETWNGKAGTTCCRTCSESDAGVHGPDCERKLRLKGKAIQPEPDNQASQCTASEEANAAPQCSTGGCCRDTWNGRPGATCCRTCSGSRGGTHGPDCERKFSQKAEESEKVPEEPPYSPRHGCLIDVLLSSAVQLPLPGEEVKEEPARLSPEEVERVFKEHVPGVDKFVYRFQDGNYSLKYLVQAYAQGVVKFKGTELENHFIWLMRIVVHHAADGKPGARGYMLEVAESFMDCQDIQARAIEHVGFQISGMTLDFRGLLVQLIDEYKAMAMKFLVTTIIDSRGGPDDWTNDPVHFENRIVADIGEALGLNAADLRRAMLDEHKDRNRPFSAGQQKDLIRKFKGFFDLDIMLRSFVSEVNSFSETSPKESIAKLFLDWVSDGMTEKHLVFDEDTMSRVDISPALAMAVCEVVFLGETKSQEDFRDQAICELFTATKVTSQ